MLSIGNNPYASYQPQVFVVDTLEVPSIDTNALSGKSSNFVEPLLDSEDEKATPAVTKKKEQVTAGKEESDSEESDDSSEESSDDEAEAKPKAAATNGVNGKVKKVSTVATAGFVRANSIRLPLSPALTLNLIQTARPLILVPIPIRPTPAIVTMSPLPRSARRKRQLHPSRRRPRPAVMMRTRRTCSLANSPGTSMIPGFTASSPSSARSRAQS